MYFAIFGTDKPGRELARHEARARHRVYLRAPGSHPVRVVLGGPTLTREGDRMNGTLLVVEAEEIAQVEAFLRDDPYFAVDLFESVVIRPWAWGLGAPEEPHEVD